MKKMSNQIDIAYVIKESHMEGEVRVIDRYKTLWYSLSPAVASEADSQQDGEREHDSQDKQD